MTKRQRKAANCRNCRRPLGLAKDTHKIWFYGQHIDTVCLDCWNSEEYDDDRPDLVDEALAERRQMGLTAF